MGKFVHLHTHSHYSLLQALPKIPELVEAAASADMPALALTDNGNLYGAIEFYKACKARGIKPIIGLDAYLAPRSRFDKETRVDNRFARLVLLARNEMGYRNLLKLVTASHLEGFYYKPRIDHELLEKLSDGLIAMLPLSRSELSRSLSEGDRPGAGVLIEWYLKTFGKDNLYLEITRHPEIENHEELVARVVAFGREKRIPLVAANEVFYLKPEDRKARETLLRIQTGAPEPEQNAWGETEEDFSLIGPDVVEEYFRDLPEAVENSLVIAEACNLDLPLGKWVFPALSLKEGRTPDEELRALALRGIPGRGLSNGAELMRRLDYELSIIASKGFSPYFLVVADLLRYAREREIFTTTRGSVGGSLVSYLTFITTVNPLEYKLPFERFLNPERPSPPDIDMDIADNRRDELIQYAIEKYGEDKVAQIGTFGTMMARAAVRDVARSQGRPYSAGDRIARLIPFGSQGFPMTITHAMEIVPELDELYKKEAEAREIIDLAKRIEGCVRHISVHAAGVVIAPSPLTDFVPLQRDPKGGKIITQYDMYAVEDAGLLKFDFLGIKNLAILAHAVFLAKKFHGVDIDIDKIPLDDKKTFAMLSRGETMGLFQLNGSGMTHYLKELRPTTIYDINAMIALYRPGPMEVIPEYIRRKNNPSLVSYLDPRMKTYLGESYGLIVYQDDLLYSAIELAGYSWAEADKFRKAVGKKIPAEMAAQREKFISGVIKNGQTKPFAEKLWKLFEPFQAYGFNKAHAASYGKVAYQTAYMKANFPALYMAAVLTSDAGDVEKIAEGVNECKRMGIPVLPPDVNESFGDFTVIKTPQGERDAIRFGLHSIKNFGEGIADSIIAQRKRSGPFVSLADFLERIQDKNLNRKSLEALIKSGALDSFKEERGTMIKNIEYLLKYHREAAGGGAGQDSIFGLLPEDNRASSLSMEKGGEVNAAEKLVWEKELLGLYISGHPLDKFKHRLEKIERDIRRVKEEVSEGMLSVVAGIVEEVKPILTKSGERMAFVRLADFTDHIEVVVFPRMFVKHQSLFAPERCIAIKGRMSERNGGQSIIAEAVKEL